MPRVSHFHNPLQRQEPSALSPSTPVMQFRRVIFLIASSILFGTFVIPLHEMLKLIRFLCFLASISIRSSSIPGITERRRSGTRSHRPCCMYLGIMCTSYLCYLVPSNRACCVQPRNGTTSNETSKTNGAMSMYSWSTPVLAVFTAGALGFGILA